MVVGALFGYLFYRNNNRPNTIVKMENKPFNWKKIGFYLSGVCLGTILLWIIPTYTTGGFHEKMMLQRNIAFTFSSMSLTLFGGGYVIIPAIQEIIVEGLNWLTAKEFADAIAMGQITPGPIFISATFIGYKIGGILGAITATMAIFLPPAFLMIFASHFLAYIKQSKKINAIFKGLRPAVIGMIFAASYTISKDVSINWITAVIFVGVLVASLKFKVNVVYLIPLSGVLGLILYTYA